MAAGVVWVGALALAAETLVLMIARVTLRPSVVAIKDVGLNTLLSVDSGVESNYLCRTSVSTAYTQIAVYPSRQILVRRGTT